MARGSTGDMVMACVSRVRETRSMVEWRTTKEWAGMEKEKGDILEGSDEM